MKISKYLSIILLFSFIFFLNPLISISKDKNDKIINDEWLGIYYKNSKLGFLHSEISKGADGYRSKTTSYLKTEIFGTVQEITFVQESSSTKDFRPIGFTLIQEIMNNKQKITGIVDDGQMVLETISSSSSTSKTIEIKKNTYLSSDVMLMVVEKGLFVGANYKLNVLIESLQSIVPIEIKVTEKKSEMFNGRQTEVFLIEESMNNLIARLWITRHGETVRQFSYEGFELKSETKETALKFKGKDVPVASLIALSLIKADSSIGNSSLVSEMDIKIELPLKETLIEDNMQKILKNIPLKETKIVDLRIKRSSLKNVNTSLNIPVNEKEFLRFLKSDHVIQADHKDIKDTAALIVKDEKNVWENVKKINNWVYSYMKKVPVDSFSSLDALKTGAGECQAHTNLFTAITRSLGIPTKIITGIVYSPYYKGFIYHAWSEVYVGRWIAVDPTLGENFADATHIKLTEGKVNENLDILGYIGKININILNSTEK